MIVNEKTLELIESFEGFVPTWYRDPVGIWTVAFGHTDAAGEPKYAATKSKTFTKAEGRAIIERDLAATAAKVRQSVTVELNPNQFGACVSLAFNIGNGAFGRSTLVKKLNKGDFDGAANEFGRWVHAGGKKLNGLVRRRAAETALFRGEPVTEPAPQIVPDNWLVALIKLIFDLLKRLRK